jgi:hypothetical protein
MERLYIQACAFSRMSFKRTLCSVAVKLTDAPLREESFQAGIEGVFDSD